MKTRIYGQEPFNVAVLHGGPGAPGYMAPVARELSKSVGVIEPLQSEDSLHDQITELSKQLTEHTNSPIILIGSSWGAVLALFLAAREKQLVSKLILVGPAVFDKESSSKIEGIRLNRFSDKQRYRYNEIIKTMETASSKEKESLFNEWGEILNSSDMFDSTTTDLEVIETQPDLFKKVWSDFVSLRDQPDLLKTEFAKIVAPVTVIHGEYDPHPIEGIRPFLESCIKNIDFYTLSQCGHYPWIERHAKDKFYEILRLEL